MINNFFVLFMCVVIKFSHSQSTHRKDECEQRCKGLALCIAPIYDEHSKFCALIFKYESADNHAHDETPVVNQSEKVQTTPLSTWFKNQKTEIFMTVTGSECESSCLSVPNCVTYTFDHDTSTCTLFYDRGDEIDWYKKWYSALNCCPARAHGHTNVGCPARTYIDQLCMDTGCCTEDIPGAMNDREEFVSYPRFSVAFFPTLL